MTLTKSLVRSLVTTLAILALSASAFAQTFTHNTTTTAAAQLATDTTLTLTAVTAATGSSFGAVAAGQFIYVDQEMELITSMASTVATVQRRNRPTAHASGAPVYIGPGSAFQRLDPPAGTCTTANQPKWWINVDQGTVFTCGANSVWAKSNAPWYMGANSGNGATVTLTAGDSGKTFVFDRAAGIIYTLPVPYPGMTFDFVYSVTVTSNNYTVITSSGAVFVAGAVGVLASAVTEFACNGTSHVKVQSNGTTTGGVLGGRLHFTAVSATLWQVDGLLVGSGTGATPCA